MTASKRLMGRLKAAKEQASETLKPGVLPLVAFYGRGEELDEQRSRMYEMIGRVMASDTIGDDVAASMPERRSFLDVRDAVTILNAQASPIEFLVSNGEMELGPDEDGMGGVRFHTAIRFRDLVQGAQVKVLKSANLEGTGGGGFGPTDIVSYQVDCRKILQRLKSAIGDEWVYQMLEAVVVMDEWLDLWPESRKADKRGTKRKQRLKTILALHYGLDKVGKQLGYMNNAAFKQRWHRDVPEMPPSVRRRSRESRAANQLALLTSQGARSE